MSDVQFVDNSLEVFGAIDDSVKAFLHEASGELVAGAKANTAVDTGSLKGSWDYRVDESQSLSRVGSPQENAIWEEFGTGAYAEGGKGRKTPWKYQDRKGNWYTTKGKRPKRGFRRASDEFRPKFEAAVKNAFGGMQ